MKRVSEILSRYWGAFLAGGLLLIYGRLAWVDPLLERDDRHILRFMKSWEDVRYLLSVGKWGELVAYQPLKDLSLAMDVRASALFGHGTFHWTNLIVWALCCFVGLRLLEDDPSRGSVASPVFARVGLLLFAFHPLFVGSVAWVSARKHLLSFLFILLASWELVRDEKPRKRMEIHWRALAWYALALLCQPIQVLWPIWALARAKGVERRGSARERIFLRTGMVALVPLLLAGVANALYYSGLYVHHTATQKIVSFSEAGVAVPLLALGRYVSNILIPVRLAPVYEPASLLGIAGLLLLPLLVVSVRKLGKARLIASWLVFALLPLLVVTARMTQVFVSDTYALSAGFGVMAALVVAWEELEPRGWRVPVALGLVAVGFLWSSSEIAASWRSDAELWARSARVEPTGRALSIHARNLLDAGRVAEAASALKWTEKLWPREPGLSYLAARLLAEDPSLSPERRIRALEQGSGGFRREPAQAATESQTWSAYFLSELYARRGDFGLAHETMRRSLGAAENFGQDLPAVVAELQFLCQQARLADCPAEQASIQAKIQASPTLYWDSRPYNDRLRELEGLGLSSK